MKIFSLIICLFLCGCSSERADLLKIGVDPTWYPLDFGNQTVYINGFVEDMLLEMAWHEGIEWEKVSANSDSLLEGLKMGKYDAVLTGLPKYSFYVAKYDFSQNFLDLGPVFVVGVSSPYTKLKEIDRGAVGMIEGDSLRELLDISPKVQVRYYLSETALLDAVAEGEVVGAFMGALPAETYLKNVYAGSLKIMTEPLTEEGLHLISLKDQNKDLLHRFNKSLSWFKKKKMAALLEKWGLRGEPRK
jgi:polar amino acid transport system substrate-binding protein